MKIKKHIAALGALAIGTVSLVLPVFAAPTYTFSGDAYEGGGVATLISQTPTGFGSLNFAFSGATFGSITQLSADYNVTDDDCGGGSPRFQIAVDTDNNGSSDGNMFIYFGPSPGFTDCPAGPQSTGNLIGNNDAGRFDYSQLGGPLSGTYGTAPANVLSGTVKSIRIVVDSGWSVAAANGPDGEQTILIDNVQINGDTYTFDAPACVPSTTFDTFNLGSVNGQGGWMVTGPYDQSIRINNYGYPTFGCKTLRISNAVTSGSFGDQTFSPSNTNEAGETTATNNGMSGGTRQNHFEAQFDFGSTRQTPQAGLFVSISPDRGDGSRMSYIGLTDSGAGIDVNFYDVQGTSNPANFVNTKIATGLSRAVPHTLKFDMHFNDGASNDVVKIYIDGVLVHTGTSWENYYRFDSEASAEQTPRTTDSLIFMARGTAVPGNSGNGFVFDNLTMSSSTLAAVTSPLFWTEEDATQVKVDWKAVPGATSYTVYHSVDNTTFTPVFTGNALTYTHPVAVNTDHYYKVTAENALGESASGSSIAAKYAGTKDVVIDEDAMDADFNASGTVASAGSWSAFDVNNANPAVQDILSYAVGGDNHSTVGAYAGQTFDWTTAAPLNGVYDVFVTYICDSSRGTAAYNVFSGATQLNSGALLVNQALRTSDNSACGSQSGDPTTQTFWKKIGSFPISGIGRVQLVSATGNNILADAVAFHKTGNIASSAASSSLPASSAPASSSASSIASCTIPSANLAGYWKLDENGGTTAIDSAGADNTGTHENGPVYVAGTPSVVPNPSALDFDGTDDQVRIANSSDFNFGTSNFTVSTFLKTTTGDRSVLGHFDNQGPGYRGWGLYLYSTNRVNFFGYGDAGINDTSVAAPTILDGNWHNVAGVFTRTGPSLTIDTYVDGVLAGTSTVNVGDMSIPTDLLLGKYLFQPNFDGSLDDVRVYDSALSPAEIAAIAGICPPSSSSSSAPASSSAPSSAPASSSVAAAPTCDGMTATIYVNGNNKVVGGSQNGQTFNGSLNGTNGNDVIVGTSGNDKINGNNGNDVICGLAGNDKLDGGNGIDKLFGDAGNDKLDGGNAKDYLYGGADNDELDSGNGDDFLAGGSGNDKLDSGTGNDILCGGANNDKLEAGSASDKLDGGPNTDQLDGESGSDICRNGESLSSCENTVAAIPECAGL